MRMLHYFGALAALSTVALLAAALTGFQGAGGERHLVTGLFSAILTVGAHTLLIVFMIVTGRVLKAAMQSRELAGEFLAELNGFFGRKTAYPAAVLAATAAVVTGVLGYGNHAFGLPPLVHVLFGVATIGLNLWTFALELRALRENQALLDRTAAELDRIDAERLARGVPVEEEVLPPGEAARRWLIVAVSVWLPYFYWVLVPWRGDFSKVSPLWFAVLSALALACAWLTRPRPGDERPRSSD